MRWLEKDKLLREEGWHLSIHRDNISWDCYYMHCFHLPVSHRAKTFDEAISVAQDKLRGGIGEQEELSC